MRTARDRKIEDILRYLNVERVRATYGAVGGVIGVPAQSVGQYLGKPLPEASWVVRKDTKMPTGYSAEQMHRQLRCCQQVIVDWGDLRRRLPIIKGVVD